MILCTMPGCQTTAGCRCSAPTARLRKEVNSVNEQSADAYDAWFAEKGGGETSRAHWKRRALAAEANIASRLTRLEDETRRAALEEAGWFWTWDKLPKPGRKFIAVYNDGSGARMFYAFDGGVIDHEGDEYGGFTESFDRWAYLPDDCEFWCETQSEDPYTFPRALSQKGDVDG